MRRRLEEARVATLGTVSRDGAPHLVPLTFVVRADTLYSAIDRKPKTTERLARLANIESDARVAVLVQHYDEDWTRLWWVRVDGVARLLGEGAERDGAIEALAGKYERYREDPPTGRVIAVDASRWTGWEFGGRGGEEA